MTQTPKVTELKLVNLHDEAAQSISDILTEAKEMHDEEPFAAVSVILIGRDGRISMRTNCPSRIELVGHLAMLQSHAIGGDEDY